MANRVNKIRVCSKRFDGNGVFIDEDARHFFTPAAAAEYIVQKVNSTRKSSEGGYAFDRVEIGNDKGWVHYPIDVSRGGGHIVNSLIDAKEVHLAFYHDGESEFLP